jgi:amino acid transporter
MKRWDANSIYHKTKNLILGKARDPLDKTIFHKLSLIAFFAWVGLGADGLSSSCYGPDEAFRTLGSHTYLSIFVALGTAITILVISTSYSQIIELFPSGGGGYLVASKLLSPRMGMISGCALLIDYVLTISVSIASGADALFSFLPLELHPWKIWVAVAGVILLSILNLRGVKESVLPLVPIFLIFLITHAFAIIYAFSAHVVNLPQIVKESMAEAHHASSELGLWGLMILLLRSYSMGAGTYTGIEAVSNGLPILREPKVQTAKRTMHYMTISLATMAVGLLFGYLLIHVSPQPGKTLNAVFMHRLSDSWGYIGSIFVMITLISEAVLLFVAAQTGFLDGPRVLANMALDRWVPTNFALLSDRLITQNGILLMGITSLITVILSKSSVQVLVILYSINVFITFVLSQAGMVRHWWTSRRETKNWQKKLGINGIGLCMCSFILVSVVILKFNEGGWITLAVTSILIITVISINRHYRNTASLLRKLDRLLPELSAQSDEHIPRILRNKGTKKDIELNAKTAILMVNGFSGLGLRTLYNIFELFEDTFKNFVFIQIGMLDAGNFKGSDQVESLKKHIKSEIDKYVSLMKHHGYYSEGYFAIATDIVDAVEEMAPRILERFPHSVFFGGKIVFPKETLFTRILHNNTAFMVQRRLYHKGIPSIVLPVQVEIQS